MWPAKFARRDVARPHRRNRLERSGGGLALLRMKNPFRYFNSSHEVVRLITERPLAHQLVPAARGRIAPDFSCPFSRSCEASPPTP